jgi:hypothetical protein
VKYVACDKALLNVTLSGVLGPCGGDREQLQREVGGETRPRRCFVGADHLCHEAGYCHAARLEVVGWDRRYLERGDTTAEHEQFDGMLAVGGHDGIGVRLLWGVCACVYVRGYTR